jgi:hypothetical protein
MRNKSIGIEERKRRIKEKKENIAHTLLCKDH